MELIAYDGNKWRVERLEKLVRVVSAMTGLSAAQLEALIDTICDQKGELIVQWKHEGCSDRMRLAFRDAWNVCGETNVHHSDGSAK
jgi:hypothetical protein